MKKKDFWKDVSDDELLNELGRRLKKIRIMEETVKTAMNILEQKKRDHGVWGKKIIDFDDLSIRTKNALLRPTGRTPGLVVFRQVCGQRRLELSRRVRIGPKTLDEIEQWVKKHGGELKS